MPDRLLRSRGAFVIALTLALSIFFVWPMVLPGPILGLDTSASPLVPVQFGGLALNAVFLQKVYLASIVSIGLLGLILAMGPLRITALAAAGIFWVASPFLVDHLAAARWHLAATVAVLPWLVVVARASRLQPWLRWAALVVLSFGIFLHYPRAASFIEVIVWALLLTWGLVGRGPWQTRLPVAGLGLGLVITVAHILGLKLAQSTVQTVTADQLPLFEVGQGPALERLVGAVSYLGFWAERAGRLPSLLTDQWWWNLIGLVWLGVAIIGWRHLLRVERPLGVALITTYLLSLGLVLSNTPLLAPELRLNLYTSLGLVGLRETSKFMGLMLVTQAIGLGYGVHVLLAQTTRRAAIMTMLTVAALGIGLPRTSALARWAFTPVSLPPTLVAVAREANAHYQVTIVFPWHRFQAYPFTADRVVDQIGPVLFARPVYNDLFEFNGQVTNSLDPWQQRMADATTSSELTDALWPLLSERGVQTIVVFKVNDDAKYRAWADSHHLSVLAEDESFVQYAYP